MEKSIYAKFSQNKTLLNILLLTKDSKLIHFNKGRQNIANELMNMRNKLKEGESDQSNFKIGSNVQWNIKGNSFTGIIDKIDGNKVYVINDIDNSIKKIPINKLYLI